MNPTCVRHGEEPRHRVRAKAFVKLVGEFSPIDGLATGAVASGEVSTLKHEAARKKNTRTVREEGENG